jgi:tetratricopeptide (TPR) repeat protein
MRKAISRRLSLLSIVLVFLMQPLFAGFKEAATAYRDKKYKEAIQQIKPDLDQDPNWEPGHRILGLCYLELGDNAQAISALSQAVKLNSPVFPTYFGLAQAYCNRKEYDKCIGALNQGEPIAAKGKTADQDKEKLYRYRATAYFNAGNYNNAVSDLTNTIRLNSSNPSDYYYLGCAYIQLGRTDEGISALEKSLSMKAGQSAVTDLLGKAYFGKGFSSLTAKQYASAVQFLLKSKEYDPKNGNTYFRLGEAYLFLKNYPEAEKSLNQSMNFLSNDADAYERLGLVFEKQKKWDAALDAYKKADQISSSKALKDAMTRVIENKKNPDQGAAKTQGAKTR